MAAVSTRDPKYHPDKSPLRLSVYEGGADTHFFTHNCYSFLRRIQVIVQDTDNRAKATSCALPIAAQHEYNGCALYSTSILTRS